MDKLTRESNEHGRIVESMVFFERFLEAFTSNEAPDYIERLHRFSDEYIVNHFKFEEEEIFPYVLKAGGEEEKKLVQSLQEEHVRILETLAEFQDLVSFYDAQPDREQVKKIITSSEVVISMILVHAQKEDKYLFPALERYAL